jgi:hypothetical protein
MRGRGRAPEPPCLGRTVADIVGARVVPLAPSSHRMDSPAAGHATGLPGMHGTHQPRGIVDLVVALAFAVTGAVAAIHLPAGSTPRLLLVLPVLFVVPGYLLLQATVERAGDPLAIVRQLLVGIGVSIALVGVVALSTAILPTGFKEGPIIAAVTASCFLFGGLAALRRTREAWRRQREDEDDRDGAERDQLEPRAAERRPQVTIVREGPRNGATRRSPDGQADGRPKRPAGEEQPPVVRAKAPAGRQARASASRPGPKPLK